MPFGLVHQQTF